MFPDYFCTNQTTFSPVYKKQSENETILQPSSVAVFYIKLAKGCLILPSSVTDFDERLYTIVGKTGYTLIRLAKTCLCISTQCDSVHTILGKTSYILILM